MRKIFFLLPLIAAISTSCGNTPGGDDKEWSWGNYKSTNSLNMVSKKLQEKENISFDVAKHNALLDAVAKALDDDNTNSFMNAMIALLDAYDKASETYSFANAFYYKDGNARYLKISEDIEDFRVDTSSRMNEFYIKAKDCNNDIKYAMFGTTDRQEIQEIIEGSQLDSDITAAYYAMQDVVSEAEQEFYNDLKLDDLGKYAEFMIREADAVWPYAEKYDLNPSEFLSTYVYDRRYSLSALPNLLKNVQDYLAPVVPEGQFIVDSSIYNDIVALAGCALNYPLSNGKVPGQYLDEYVEYFSTSTNSNLMKNKYLELFRDGYYLFSNSENSMGTAYIQSVNENLGIAFFSADYQNVSTVVHEFGHYFAKSQGYGEDAYYQSLDIEETHSQANEMCFANYLKTQYGNQELFNCFADFQFFNIASQLPITAFLVDVENYVFTTKGVSKTQVVNYASQQFSKYSSDPLSEFYWIISSISPMYYVSYLTSGIASLQFYTKNLSVALSAYKKLTANFDNSDEVTKWKNCGIISPFEKDSFTAVSNELSRIVEEHFN